MHIAEGFLPPVHSAAWTIAAAPFVVHGAVQVVKKVREEPDNKLLLAGAGAFTFLLSAIKLPSVTGSSSHATGTGAGAVLFKPPVMAFLSTVVLLFQALLLAHGGITTLGANVFSMGIVGPWVGYLCWWLVKKANGPAWLGVFLAFAMADLATYCVTSAQLALAYPEPDAASAAAKFLGIFAVTQIPLAITEGLIGILVFQILGRVAGEHLVRLGVVPAPEPDPVPWEPGAPVEDPRLAATATATAAATPEVHRG